jgi:hypothetical protein
MTNVQFYILGPRRRANEPALWAVSAHLLEWKTANTGGGGDWWSRSARNVFIDRVASPIPPNAPTNLPGTIIARCRIRGARLNVLGTDHDFLPSGAATDVELLLQAAPGDWTQVGREVRLLQAVCVGGSIPMDRMTPKGASWSKLFESTLSAFAELTLSSSGLIVDAEAKLPWMPDHLPEARYLIEVRLPDDPNDPEPPLVVLLDNERLVDFPDAEAAYRRAFATLGGILAPTGGPNDSTLRQRPRWSDLQLTDPTSLPEFYWDVRGASSGKASMELVFGPGQWKVALSDQAPRVPGVSPRGTLSASPVVTLRQDGASRLRVGVIGVTPSTRPVRVPFAGDPVPIAAQLPPSLTAKLKVQPGALEWNGLAILDRQRQDLVLLAVKLLAVNPALGTVFRSSVEALLRALDNAIWVPFAGGLAPTSDDLPPSLAGRLRILPDALEWSGLALLEDQQGDLEELAADNTYAAAFRNAVNALLARLESLAQARYTATLSGTNWSESIEIQHLTTAYDAAGTADFLRSIAGLPVPRPDEESQSASSVGVTPGVAQQGQVAPVRPQVLWGFLPLEKGWAQLPFLNITESIYVDALPQPNAVEGTALLAGAAAFGNDRVGAFSPAMGEPPWTLTLLDADDYLGEWVLELDAHSGKWGLTGIELRFARPEATIEGLTWLATAAPSSADALPTLDDWLGGLSPLVLRTPRVVDRYPSPFVFRLESLVISERSAKLKDGDPPFSSATLGKWAYSYEANSTPIELVDTVFARLLGKPPYDASTLWLDLPIVWRRHPAAPMIQALPMTQTRRPPNYPSASRQLAPFELGVVTPSGGGPKVPGDWRFSCPGATSWPDLSSTADAALAWSSVRGLHLAALGIPGLVLDPGVPKDLISGAGEFLPAQYHHGLPVLDELQALAELPKDDAALTRDAADSSKVPPPRALLRGDYASYWARLAELAFFAEADADPALVKPTGAAPAGGSSRVVGLIEPFGWPVDVSVSLTPKSFPGSITFKDASSGLTLTLPSAAHDALGGFAGRFLAAAPDVHLLADGKPADYIVSGGTLAAALDASARLRDQRGLHRGTSDYSTVGVVRSPVQLEEGPALELISTLATIPFTLPDATKWEFWFRDLAVTVDAPRIFHRAEGRRSNQARGVNNPAAMSRGLSHQNGHEWRLGAKAAIALPFGPLVFLPLTLESVGFDAKGHATSVEVVGRLQLPIPRTGSVPDASEQTDRSNAVRLRFRDDGGGLALKAIEIEPPELDPDEPPGPHPESFGEWPLGKEAQAPVLRWTNLRLDAGQMKLDLQLRFSAHGVIWVLPVHTNQTIAFGDSNFTLALDRNDFNSSPDDPVAVLGGKLTLNFATNAQPKPDPHALTLDWQFLWGEDDELELSATYTETVIPAAKTAGPFAASLSHKTKHLPLALAKKTAAPDLEGGAVQIEWDAVQSARDIMNLQLLPGLHVTSTAEQAIRGFAVMTFTISGRPDGPPTLSLNSGFLEALFGCDWGESLQQAHADHSNLQLRVFGSSAGQLDVGYTVEYDPGASDTHWPSRLVLNGVLEVKDLISWPTTIQPDPVPDGNENVVTVPASRPDGVPITGWPALDHVRHSARILFDQHKIPSEAVVPSESDDILLEIAAGESWQPLVIVEHQLVTVRVNPASEPELKAKSLAGDLRFCAVQEARFCSPKAFRAALLKLNHANTVDSGYSLHARSAPWIRNIIRMADQGYHTGALIDLLAAPSDASGTSSEVMKLGHATVVELGAPLFVRVAPDTASASGIESRTNMQYLPRGTQRGVMSALADFYAAEEDPPAWFLLTLPFLGRLQARESDGLNAATVVPSLLCVDPVLQIDRDRRVAASDIPGLPLGLASWEDKNAKTFQLAEFDLARHRFVDRLDPSSLRESWFRLNQAPTIEKPKRLAGILATLPSDAPSVLGRPEVLVRVFDPARLALPPRADAVPAGVVDGPAPTAPRTPPIQWRPESLQVLQASMPPTEPTSNLFGFLAVGVQVRQAGLLVTGLTKPRRLTAATLIPPRLTRVDDGGKVVPNPQPVSLAASPLLGLDLVPQEPAPKAKRLIAVTELLVLDATGHTVISAATRPWLQDDPNDELAIAWAKATKARLAFDSPIALLQVRELFSAKAAGGVAVAYRFVAVDQPPTAPRMVRRALALRAEPPWLRVAEGAFGGTRMPPTLASFELAPPQVRGAQPIRIDHRDGADWPWGLSAMRIAVRATKDAAGVAWADPALHDGAPPAARLWWVASFHHVQYLVPEDRPPKLLPRRFRARAVSSYLPAWPAVPLPDIKTLGLGRDWQPALAGGHRALYVGARPGVPFLFREHLLTQDASDPAGTATADPVSIPTASGGVPVQHRFPRPIRLPENVKGGQDHAVQSWGSHFDWSADKGSNLWITPSPADAAFLVPEAPIGLDLSLEVKDSPLQGGVVPSSWDGKLVFAATGRGGTKPKEWSAQATLTDGVLTAACDPVATTSDDRLAFQVKADQLVSLLQGKPHGAPITARVTLGHDAGFTIKGLRQALSFPLRVARPGHPVLPLRPAYTLFEDPEYNRLLASTTAHASRIVQAGGVASTLTLAVDRREYNPTSVVQYVFFRDPTPAAPLLAGKVRLFRVREGNPTVLKEKIDLPEATLLTDPAFTDLSQFRNEKALVPGDGLMIELTVPALDPLPVSVRVDIVAQPVIPVPEAGFALLRRDGDDRGSVECVRFAWGPEASRVEMINPDDLRKEVVRRRAVFRWGDTGRVGQAYGYAVQKTTSFGSTHFPDFTSLTQL